MTLRGYGAMCTSVIGAIFGFEALWLYSKLDAIEAMYCAMVIGMVACTVFMFATEKRDRHGAQTKSRRNVNNK